MTLHKPCPLCGHVMEFCDNDVGQYAVSCPSSDCNFVLHLDNPQLPRDLSVQFVGLLFDNMGRPLKYFSSHAIKLELMDNVGCFDVYFRHSSLPNLVLN